MRKCRLFQERALRRRALFAKRPAFGFVMRLADSQQITACSYVGSERERGSAPAREIERARDRQRVCCLRGGLRFAPDEARGG